MGGQIGLEVLVFAGTDWTWFRQEAQIDKRTAELAQVPAAWWW